MGGDVQQPVVEGKKLKERDKKRGGLHNKKISHMSHLER